MNVLVVDVGGTHVKLFATRGSRKARFDSGEALTPPDLVSQVEATTHDWEYDVVSLGVPAAVDERGVRTEPGNLGNGWVGVDFGAAFGKPVRVVNDAVLQAIGGYRGRRMLFLGLGTGLGSALVTEHVVVPLELGSLPDCGKRTMADAVGADALDRLGRPQWLANVHRVTDVLRQGLSADYVVIGGGNARYVEPLPPHALRGENEDAFHGGVRLWEDVVEPHDRRPARVWRVVR